LEQLGHYLKNNQNIEEIDEQFALKRDCNDLSKVEPKSFNELMHLYIRLKEENDELLRDRAHYEKVYKKELEKLEGEHTKKMNKLTKDFNESFGLLCQRSGLHHTKDKNSKKVANHKEVQVEPTELQIMRKRSYSRTEIEDSVSKLRTQQMIENATQELHDQIKEREEKIRDQHFQLERNREIIQDTSRRLNERQ
jgi:hypothetical protein